MENLDEILGTNIRIMAQTITEVCLRSTLALACPVALTRNQFSILKITACGNSLPISILAGLLDISNAAVSKNIDRLAHLGLVVRKTDPRDRRRHEIILLDPGRDIVRAYDRILEQKQTHLMEQFSPWEKAVLLGLLQRVIRFTLAEEQDTEMICLQCGGHCGDHCVVAPATGTGPRRR